MFLILIRRARLQVAMVVLEKGTIPKELVVVLGMGEEGAQVVLTGS
jgi:hypothetical protein